MRAGDHRRACLINDAVLQARRAGGEIADDPGLPYHRRFVWTGRPLAGASVLVRCYHGLGDTLMASRFLAPLRDRARHVTVEAPQALVPLLARMGVADRILAFDPAAPLPPDAVDVEIMELAHALRLGPGDAPGVPPALATAPLASQTVGFCWRAGEWLSDRSLPFERLAPLLAACGRPLLSLQHGPALADARRLDPDLFTGPARGDDTLERTASLVACAAVVVSVDTMIAHLALLLGRPTIVLLKADADWRWGRPDGPSPWYPDAILLRQRTAGDWTGPLAALASHLEADVTAEG